MKNKVLCVLILLNLISFGLIGQNVKLKLSDEIKLERKKVLSGLLHHDDSGYYMTFETPAGFLSTKRELSIAKYDKKFKQKYLKTYSSTGSRFQTEGTTKLGDQFVWLQSKRDTKDKVYTLYAVPISKSGKAGKPKTLIRAKYEKNRDVVQFDWKINEDSTKLLVIAEIDRNAKNRDYISNFAVFDSELKSIWKKSVKFKESQRQVDRQSFELAKNGEAYITARIFEDNKSAGVLSQAFSSDSNYDNYFVKINGEGHKRYKLDLGDKFIKGFKIEESEFDESLVCVAMTGNTISGPILGMSYFKIDANTGEITYAKNRNFSDEEIDKFGRKNTSKDRRSKEKGLDDSFIFREIISYEDGSFIIVAEEYKVTIRTTTDAQGNSRTTSLFRNNHIVIARADNDGTIQNIDIIPKKYSASKNGYPSSEIYEEKTHYMFYSTLTTNDITYFLYNDDEKNFSRNVTDIDRYKTVTRFNECVAVIAHIDESGKLVRKELFKKEDTGSIMMPKFSVELTDTELFVFLKRRKLLGKNSFKFGILEVE